MQFASQHERGTSRAAAFMSEAARKDVTRQLYGVEEGASVGIDKQTALAQRFIGGVCHASYLNRPVGLILYENLVFTV